MKLIASLIARNEAARYQPLLCRHLLSFCDEIRVLDDASTDGTGDAIDRLDPRVKVKRALGSSIWDVHGEGIARGQLLDWTMEGRPTHVLAIDADEFVPDGQALRKLLRRNVDGDVFELRMVEVWNRTKVPWQVRIDGGWAPRRVPICWRVPTDAQRTGELPDGWEIRNARLACGREPEMVSVIAGFGDAVNTGLDVCHLGWSDPLERRPRYERYMKLDGGSFHAREHLESILTPPELEDYPAYPAMVAAPAERPAAEIPPDQRFTTM